MSQDIRLKQGASLTLQIAFQNADLSMLDLSPFTLRAQVRDLSGNLVAVLPIVSAAPTTGVATVSVASTALWPIGTLRSDILLLTGDYAAATETFGIIIERPVTQ